MKASVSVGTKLKVPGKNDPEVIELIKLLKSFHKWKDVEMLDGFKLVKMIEDEEFNSEELKKLKKFIEKKKFENVRLGKFDKGED